MIVDTSALLAIFLAEPERKQFLDVIIKAETRFISAVNVLETEAKPRVGSLIFSCIMRNSRWSQPIPNRSKLRVAWRKYGKGRYPAGLNFGDCFAYALAKVMDEPILLKGDDFAHTDLAAATT